MENKDEMIKLLERQYDTMKGVYDDLYDRGRAEMRNLVESKIRLQNENAILRATVIGMIVVCGGILVGKISGK